jgi:hypothetical protein
MYCFKSFISNFDDSLIYKTYAIVYLDRMFRNKGSSSENHKTKFIKWKDVIFEVCE